VLTPLTLTVAVFLFALAVWGIGLAVAGRPPDRAYVIGVLLGEAEVLLHGAAALIAIAAGHRPDSMGEYLGYLLTSVVLLPFVLRLTHDGRSTRWDSATIGAVALAVGVAVIRLLGLW